MAGIRGIGRLHLRAIAADLLQGAGQPGRITGELHRGGIGQKLALTADGGLDQTAKKHSHRADENQGHPDDRQRVFFPAIAAAHVEQNPADGGKAENPKQDAHELKVQAHVAVEDMAELVANDALQLVARQLRDATARDTHGGIAGGVPCSEGVNALLMVEHVNFGHRHTGGDGHLLDDVEKLAFVRVARAGIHLTAAHGFSHHPAAAGELADLEQAAECHDGQGDQGGAKKDLRIPQRQRRLRSVRPASIRMRPGASEHHQPDQVIQDDNEEDGDDKVKNQQLGFFAGPILSLEEIHPIGAAIRIRGLGSNRQARRHPLPQKIHEKETLGATFSSGLSTANSSAEVKLNIPAIRLLGNTSRPVL